MYKTNIMAFEPGTKRSKPVETVIRTGMLGVAGLFGRG